jgi:hypothetical protein
LVIPLIQLICGKLEITVFSFGYAVQECRMGRAAPCRGWLLWLIGARRRESYSMWSRATAVLLPKILQINWTERSCSELYVFVEQRNSTAVDQMWLNV